MDNKHTIADAHAVDLWSEIENSRTADRSVFEEMRSCVRLVAGDQYKKRFTSQLRLYRNEFGVRNESNRIHITKNHTRRMYMEALNNLLNVSPWVVCSPNNEKELQDNKAATLNNSVLSYAKKKYDLKKKIRKYAGDFLNVGEVWVYLYWDPNKGEVVDYEQAIDPQTGQPMFKTRMEAQEQEVIDPNTGQPIVVSVPMEVQEPIKDENKPIYSGDFVFKRIMGWNILRPETCTDFDEAEWLAFTELMTPKKLKEWVGEDAYEKLQTTGIDANDYFVFNESTSGFAKQDNVVEVATMLYRPCKKYPQGYYKIFTRTSILFEGELPFGEWPLVHTTYDEAATMCRGLSFVKPLKSPQIEINRASSMMAEHQITLGSDKIFHEQGTKLSMGFNSPGVRHISYTGEAPVVVQGRSGEQFAPYKKDEINEMYMLGGMEQMLAEMSGNNQQVDSYAQLFKNMDRKKRNSFYCEKFADFLVDLCSLYLRLARHYYDDNMLIPMIGKDEVVNIAEFRGMNDLMTSITVEEASEDLDTVFGKTLMFQQLLQFIGPNLPPSAISSIIKSMPFGGSAINLVDYTLEEDIADNLILALERGETPEPPQNVNIGGLLRRLDRHMMMADFKLLEPQIQEMFENYRTFYIELEQERVSRDLMAQKDFIPTGGGRVRTDLKVPSKRPDGRTVTENLVVPTNSLHWLADMLKKQGELREELEGLTPDTKEGVMDNSVESKEQLTHEPQQYEGFENQGG